MNDQKRVFSLKNEAATEALGARLAGLLRPGDIICLSGDLGAGKTCLARGLLRALADDPDLDVPSPTFTLVQTYALADKRLWHFDLYRLERPEEIWELGFEDALEDICLIEWPERADKLVPSEALTLSLTFEGEGRKAGLSGPSSWQERLGNV